jgi:hypothetical protein
MIWLALYLAAGAIVLVMAWGLHWLAEWRRGRARSGRPGPSRAAPGRLRHRIQSELVVPAIASLGMVLAWPLVAGIFVRSWLPRTAPVAPKAEPAFAVAAGDLLEPLSIQDIESREVVSDPLGAVPDLPFGHLHPAWRRFLDGQAPSDRLWRFRTAWPPYGTPTVHLGYARVRDGAVVAHILLERRPPDTPATE